MILNTKRIYETPAVDIVELANAEAFLATSTRTGATFLDDVEETVMDFKF